MGKAKVGTWGLRKHNCIEMLWSEGEGYGDLVRMKVHDDEGVKAEEERGEIRDDSRDGVGILGRLCGRVEGGEEGP